MSRARKMTPVPLTWPQLHPDRGTLDGTEMRRAAGAGLQRRALVVEDERPIRDLVVSYLRAGGLDVSEAATGLEGVEQARAEAPDVIVLDLMLPGLDGVEACRRIRTFSDAYVLMLTARADEIDKLVGLAVGADDYLTKPFSPRELVARVEALLRRPRTASPTVAEPPLRVGRLIVDRSAHEVMLDERRIQLTRLEFELLAVLAAEPRVAFSRRALVDRVWGESWVGDERIVDVHVRNLRRKLGDHAASPRVVRTVRGVGYRIGEG